MTDQIKKKLMKIWKIDEDYASWFDDMMDYVNDAEELILAEKIEEIEKEIQCSDSIASNLEVSEDGFVTGLKRTIEILKK